MCLSPAGARAGDQTAMTQRGYLQSMARICGDSLAAPTTDTALINWARRKGMNPGGGWNLDAELTKEVMAYTLVQLLNLAPAKADVDPVRILDAKGIFIKTSAGHVTPQNFAASLMMISFGAPPKAAMTTMTLRRQPDLAMATGTRTTITQAHPASRKVGSASPQFVS